MRRRAFVKGAGVYSAFNTNNGIVLQRAVLLSGGTLWRVNEAQAIS